MGGSSSKKQTVGYRYYFSIHMGLCAGPVDELVEIKVGDRTAWSGSVTGSEQVYIDNPDLFGGESAEGGVQGYADVMMGEATQPVNGRIVSMLGGVVPAFRNMVTLFFDGLVCCNNPYPKAWDVRLRRNLKGWDGDVWEPSLAVINMQDQDDNEIKAANPAHILLQCNTNRDWGRGLDRSRLDLNSYLTAAQTLFKEGFGLCLRWSRSGTVSEFIQSVLNHIGAAQFVSRKTGLLTLRLIRDDYDRESLPVFSVTSGLLGIDDGSTSSGSVAANEVVVTWHDPVSNEDRQVRERNLGAIRAAGGTITTKTDYPGIPTAALAHRVAARDVRANTSGLSRLTVRLDRRGWSLDPADVFIIDDEQRGRQLLRIGSIDYGTLTAGTVTVTAVEDVFGLPDAGTSSPERPDWTPPDTSAKPAPAHRIIEASYRDLSVPGLNDLVINDEDTTGYLLSMASRPSSLSLNYQLDAAIAADDMTFQGYGDFTPSATLSAELETLAGTAVLTALSDVSLITFPCAALINDEIIRVDVMDITTGEISIGRGCVDTLPQKHSAGSHVWFYDIYNGHSEAQWLAGLEIKARMLTRTSSAQLASAMAPVDTLTMTNRARRPYIPGRIQVNGVDYPGQVETNDSYIMTWAHRDRLLQSDQLIDCTLGNIGPEPGSTYVITVTDEAGAIVWETSTAENIIAIPYITGMPLPDDESHYLTLQSSCNGLTSIQIFKTKLPEGHIFEIPPTPGDV
jgi:hypothetical protein